MTRRVGNDVVDLLDPRIRGKAGDERFVRRVLAASEIEVLGRSSDPDRTLFLCWAGKEAAYKVASKLRGTPPIFEHRAFVFDGEGVSYEGDRFPVRVEDAGSTLHAVATSGVDPDAAHVERHALDQAGTPWDAPLEKLVGSLTTAEAEAVHSRASAAVRIGARRALARLLEVRESRLQIVCAPGVTGRRPPHVLLDGVAGPADVSLSHHGGHIGWAIVLDVSARTDGS